MRLLEGRARRLDLDLRVPECAAGAARPFDAPGATASLPHLANDARSDSVVTEFNWRSRHAALDFRRTGRARRAVPEPS